MFGEARRGVPLLGGVSQTIEGTDGTLWTAAITYASLFLLA